jgi:hypothetical protein
VLCGVTANTRGVAVVGFGSILAWAGAAAAATNRLPGPWEGTWKAFRVSGRSCPDAFLRGCGGPQRGYTPRGSWFLKKMYGAILPGWCEGGFRTFRKVDGSVLGTVSYRSAGTAPSPGNDKPWLLFEAVGDPGRRIVTSPWWRSIPTAPTR